MSKKQVWRNGPPPSLGWWPASRGQLTNSLRWWNGRYWSDAAFEFDGSAKAARVARRKAELQHQIQWTDRPEDWPARSKT